MADAPPTRDTPDAEDAMRTDAVLEALWTRVLDAWDDERTHAALLDHALSAGALPEIAGRYRKLADDAEKGVLAKRRLDTIVQAATQLLFATRMPRPGKTPLSITLSALGVCLLLLLWLAYALFSIRR
jgi:hypothetical protein